MSPAVSARMLLATLVRPVPGRAGYAIRLTAICAAITVVIEVYQLPSLATTVYAAFFLLRPDRGATIFAAIVMTLFITVSLLIALLLTASVLDHPFWRVCAMAIFSFVILFIGSASKLRPLAPTLAMIGGYVLDLIGGLQFGEIAVRGVLYTWLVIAIPAAIVIVAALIASPPPRRLLEAALAARLSCAALVLRGDDAGPIRRLDAFLQRGDSELRALLASARREQALGHGADAALTRAVDAITSILSYVSLLVAAPGQGAPGSARESIADTLDEMAAILRRGAYPSRIVPPRIADDALPPSVKRLTGLLADELAGFSEGPVAPRQTAAGGFMVPDAWTNPDHVRYALKTTGAAMACYLAFLQLDWPGIHTCLITCYVVSLGNAGETIEKLTLRICGCLVGAALGFATLIWVIPQIDGIAALAMVIALGTLPAAWVAASGPRVSYAGLQLAFAFYLTVLQKPEPAFDLSLGRDRIIGVIFGNLMIYLVFTRLWPVSISRQIDAATARLLAAMAALARSGRDAARRDAGDLRNRAAALRQDLRVARYEPVAIRPGGGWIETREQVLDEVDRMQALLLVHTAGADAAGRWLDALARRVGGARDAVVPSALPADPSLADRLIRLDGLIADFGSAEGPRAQT